MSFTGVLGKAIIGKTAQPGVNGASGSGANEFFRDATDSPTLSEANVVTCDVAVSSSDTLSIEDCAEAQTNDSAVDSLSLTESSASADIESVSASDTVSLTELSQTAGTVEGDSTDTLVLTDLAGAAGPLRLDLSDSLSLTESAIGAGPVAVGSSDTLSLTEQGTVEADAFDTLVLTEIADHSDDTRDTLVLTDSATSTSTFFVTAADTESVSEAVNSTQDIGVTSTDESVETAQTYDPVTNTVTEVEVGLGDAASGTVGSESSNAATDALSLTDASTGEPISSAEDTLTLTESATEDAGPRASDTLSLSDTSAASQDYDLTAASDDLSLSEAISLVVDASNVECTYSPFVGTNSDPDAPSPPASSYTAAGVTSGFRLQFPSTGTVTDEVIIRKPSFGNRDRLSFNRVNHQTRGGDLIIFSDPTWPEVEMLIVSFSGLKNEKADEIQQFMKDHLGLEIRLIDHEDRLWTGVISEVQNPKTRDSRGCYGFTISFEFQGELV